MVVVETSNTGPPVRVRRGVSLQTSNEQPTGSERPGAPQTDSGIGQIPAHLLSNQFEIPTTAATAVEQALEGDAADPMQLLIDAQNRLLRQVQEKIQESEERIERENLEHLEHRLRNEVQRRLEDLQASLSSLPAEARAELEPALRRAISTVESMIQALGAEEVNYQAISANLDSLLAEIDDIESRADTDGDLTAGQSRALRESRVYVGTRFRDMLEDMGLLGPNGLSERDLSRVMQMRQYFALLMGDAAPRSGRNRIPSSRTDEAFLRLVREAISQPEGGLTRAELETITGVGHTRQAFSAFFHGRHRAGDEAVGLNGLFEGFRGLILTCIHRNNLPVTLESLQENPEQLDQYNDRFAEFYRQYASERRFYFIDAGFEADLGRQFAEGLGLDPTAEEIAEEMERLGADAIEAQVRDDLLLRNFLVYLRQQGSRYQELRESVRVMERSGASVEEMWAATMTHLERIVRHDYFGISRRDEESQERYERRLDNTYRRVMTRIQEAGVNSDIGRAHMVELGRLISGRDERDGMTETTDSDETRQVTYDYRRVIRNPESYSSGFRPYRDPSVTFSPSAESESAGETSESADQEVVEPRVHISEVR